MSTIEGNLRPDGVPTYPRGTSGGMSPGFWGMVGLIVTEAIFFFILFLSYVYLRFQHGVEWPPDGIEKPTLDLVWVMTPVLVLSSIPAHIADVGARRGRARWVRLGLLVAIAQALAFGGLTALEWSEKVGEFLPWTNVYGSLFYTILGFHGLHVAVGIVLLAWVLWYSLRGRWTAGNHVPVSTVVLYWHFVDVVWLFIVAVVYVSPHWWP